MADETKAKAPKAEIHAAEVAPIAAEQGKALGGLPAVISRESMKRAYGDAGVKAFYEIGIAGGFGDFSNSLHDSPRFEIASLMEPFAGHQRPQLVEQFTKEGFTGQHLDDAVTKEMDRLKEEHNNRQAEVKKIFADLK